jgi:hypothetical protein
MSARGIRNNNPGNIEFNESAYNRNPWRGETGLEIHESPRFTTFSSAAYGIRAIAKLLLIYQDRYGLYTVSGMLSRWAPAFENPTMVYIDHVRSASGLAPGQEVVLSQDHQVLKEMIKAIIHFENGEQPYGDWEIDDGMRMALS